MIKKSLLILIILAGFFLTTLPRQKKVTIPAWEQRVNNERMPPEKVLDAIGLKPGMVIGEIGAGKGRYTVHLAERVGEQGKVFANDIDKSALSFLKARCEQSNIKNVTTILGDEEHPRFPKQSLDMVIMVWSYHMIPKPAPILKNLKSSLKPGAMLVILDPVDKEINQEIEEMGRKLKFPTLKERIQDDGGKYGYEIVRILTFLPRDVIYILKIKTDR